MKRAVLLNLIFVAVFIICLFLSIYIGFFFFIPIICFLPFTLRRKRTAPSPAESESFTQASIGKADSFKSTPKFRTCPKCGGEIKEPIAQYCYHCGEKL